METWKRIWREGVVPQLSTPGLEALRLALEANDARLLKGATTSPPPLSCVQDWPVEAACPIGFAGWQGDGLQTVAEVEDYFGRVCYQIDQTVGEPAACRWFINAWDEGGISHAAMLGEVKAALAQRAAGGPAAVAVGLDQLEAVRGRAI